VEKHQGIHRQLLGSGSDVSMHRQIGEEGFNVGSAGERLLLRDRMPWKRTNRTIQSASKRSVCMVVTEHLAHLAHQLEAGIRAKARVGLF
jgi:hypothetical protein